MRVHHQRPGQVVELEGGLEVGSVADVRLALHAAVDAGSGDLEVSLARVDLVDAAGLGVLVGVHRRCGRAGRRLILVDVPPLILRLLFVTKLDQVLRVRRSPVLAA